MNYARFVLVGDWLCWLKSSELVITAISLEELRRGDKKVKEIRIAEFFNSKQLQEISDKIFIEEFSPLQAIRQS